MSNLQLAILIASLVLGPLLTRLLELWKGGKADGAERAEAKAAVTALTAAVGEFREALKESARDRQALRLEFVELKGAMSNGDEAGRHAGEGLAELKGEMREAHRHMGGEVSSLRAEIAGLRAEFTSEVAHLNARFEKFLFEVTGVYRDGGYGREHEQLRRSDERNRSRGEPGG